MQENFTMFDIADRLGWRFIDKQKGYIECPFCGTKKRACNITNTFFSCLKCNTKGNYYTIYAKYAGLEDDYASSKTQKAAKELRKMFSSNDYVKKDKESEQSEITKIVKKDISELNETYRALVQSLELSETHLEALKKRGLTEKQIKGYGFRTVKTNETGCLCRILQKAKVGLKGVPGFYFDNFNHEWKLNTFNMEGYLCICPDENGLIQGFQIRLDKPKDGQKYLWLSSKGKNGGASSESPSGFFGNPKAEKIVVVDGILKACVCSCFNKDINTAFIGVAGVNNYKGLVEMLTRIKRKNFIKHIYNAYDMDEFINPICDGIYKEKCKNCKHKDDIIRCICENKERKIKGLADGSKKLYELCLELGISYERIKWDIDKDGFWQGNIKGLDDYLLSKKKIRKEVYINENGL